MNIITIKDSKNILLGLVVITAINNFSTCGFFQVNFHNINIKTKININNAFQLMLTEHRVK